MTTSIIRPASVEQKNLAEQFHALHLKSALILPNVWDVASANLAESAGAAAIATTSAGMSWSLGTADGEHLDWDGALAQIRRVAASVKVPVSVDIEAGYADLEQTVVDVISAGAVGLNIEDARGSGLLPVEEMCERIRRVRTVAEAHGIRLFINARIDAFLLGADEAEAVTLHRSSEYVAAGADGIFVPGVGGESTINALVAGIRAPVNVMVGPGAPPVARLTALGVRRISSGMALAQAAYAATQQAAREMIELGTYGNMDGGLDYGYLNRISSGAAC